MKHSRYFLAFILFLSGCGAVITGVGVAFSGSSGGNSGPPINNAPSVAISLPTGGVEKNDLISISASLIDAESNNVSLTVEWSTDQNTWHPATELGGITTDTQSDGTSNLPTSPQGSKYRFTWNSMQDILGSNVRKVTFRITPIEVSSGKVGTAGKVTFDVMNAYITTILGRLQTGNESQPYQSTFLQVYNDRVYVSNVKTHSITSVSLLNGTTSSEVGTTKTPFNGDNLLGSLTNLNSPSQITLGVDSGGETALWFCDTLNHRIRLYNTTTKFVSTLAGIGTLGYDEDTSGNNFNDPRAQKLSFPYSIQRNLDSNHPPFLCFSELGNNTIRYINLSSSSVSFYTGVYYAPLLPFSTNSVQVDIPPNGMATIAGNGFKAGKIRDGKIWIKDGSKNFAATFQRPLCARLVYTPQTGRPVLYVADDRRIRVVNLGSKADGSISFFTSSAGITVPPGWARSLLRDDSLISGNVIYLTNGAYAPKTAARGSIQYLFLSPTADTYDIFFTERAQNSIWKIDGGTGKLTRIAGNGKLGSKDNQGDGKLAIEASLAFPMGMTFTTNFLLVSDNLTNRIRAINFSPQSQTIAGKTIGPAKIDTIVQGPTPEQTDLIEPEEVIIEPNAQDLFIADAGANRILEFNWANRTGVSVVGSGIAGSSGDGGDAIKAQISSCHGIALWNDSSHKLLFVGDNGNLSGLDTSGKVRIVNFGTNAADFGSVTSLGTKKIHTLVGGGTVVWTSATTITMDLVDTPPDQVQLGTILDVIVDQPYTNRLPGVYIFEETQDDTGNTMYRLLVYNPNPKYDPNFPKKGYDFEFTINGVVGSVRTVAGGTVSALAIWDKTSWDNGTLDLTKPLSLSHFRKPGISSLTGGARNSAAATSLVMFVPLVLDHLVLGINYTKKLLSKLATGIPPGKASILVGKTRNINIGTLLPAMIRGVDGYNGDQQPSTNALLNSPHAVVYGASTGGNNPEILAIADTDNHRIRIVLGQNAPLGNSPGNILTLVGNGQGGYNGETLPPSNTTLSKPTHVAGLDITNFYKQSGTLIFIAEEGSARIRMIATKD